MTILSEHLIIPHIISTVASAYGLEREALTGPSRRKRHVEPRMIAMALARAMASASLPRIGEFFGGRDHTSVLHALRKIEQRRQEEPDLDLDYRALESLCRQDQGAASVA